MGRLGQACEALVVILAALKQHDPAVARQRVENDREPRAGLMRVGTADARPGRFAAAGALDGVGDQDRIVGHGISLTDRPVTSSMHAVSISSRFER